MGNHFPEPGFLQRQPIHGRSLHATEFFYAIRYLPPLALSHLISPTPELILVFSVARSLIPGITLAPEQIGQPSPAERLFGLACHSWPHAAVHHTFLFDPYVICSGVSGRFFSDHSLTSSGCTDAKLLPIVSGTSSAT